ncbi:hypothetical protein SLNWT_6352 [Streptomyces albus]|uniref:Uncharacterized protein n=1 Tax=Streptomyces albus (strain ATCC 21838 / DSM 41398 / FERM P-419 / JCM 4703 / NBRC 107858) TaxID=1081613 RepID=A0A0B5EV71_STRA4|nr:hypothetical protein SLNWT_6352 [Streptomyces albus]AOU81032.1 hypothetical protein SLNHY_6341 [Streptomyces albus]AYN36734.1 hypothetical protein DUI70_6241 [Streptomyces albus]
MDAWGTLLATVTGAAIAILGQYLTKRSEARAKSMELLMDACAQVAASSGDLLNRIWEEYALGLEGRVVQWDLAAHRLASARVEILARDAGLLAALREVDDAGQALGAYWRRGEVEEAAYRSRRDRYRAAMHEFLAQSSRVLGRQLNRA